MIPSREHLLSIFRAAETRDVRPEQGIAEWLYTNCYTVRHPNSWTSAGDGGASILDQLAAANTGRDGWDLGWTAEFAASDGRVLAAKGDARRWFFPGQFITLSGPDRPPAADQRIQVFAPIEARALQESFYFAFGETVSPLDPSEEFIRVYWNVTVDGAPRLLSQVTRQFNRFQIPFRFKSVHRIADFHRLDAAVLYVHRCYWPVVAMLLDHVRRAVEAWLEPDTPLFTKPLAAGVALAEDPPGGGSFGEARCKILAATLDSIRSKKLIEDRAQVEEYRSQFLGHGIDPERPYLNQGSDDIYDALS